MPRATATAKQRAALPEGLGLYWHKKTGVIWTRFWINGREFRRSCGTRDPREAPEAAARCRADARAEVLSGGDPGRAKLEWLATQDILERSKKKRTEAHTKSLTSRWAVILRHIGVTYADEVTRQVLADFEATRRAGVWGQIVRGKKRPRTIEGWVDRPARGQTIVREFQALLRGLKRAQEDGKLAELPPFPTVDRDPPDERRAGKRWPPELIRTWAASLHQDARDEVLFCALTGLRYQECKKVEARWIRSAPRGSETEFVLQIPPQGSKTRKERFVGLTTPAAQILARRIDEEPRRAKVFSPSEFRKHRETKARHLGFPAPPTMRDLRHTYASIALELTSDPGALMRALGHEDLRMTERYISSTVERITAVSAAVGSVILPEHPTGSPEAQIVVSMARGEEFESPTFGSGGHSASRNWLQILADIHDQERLRTARDGGQPEHQTGAPERKLA